MTDQDLRTRLNAQFEAERKFIAEQNSGPRRVKIPQGHAWLLRFLPVEMGPNKSCFVRVAKHWLNFRPIVCPKYTAVDWGGNPKSKCPVCDMAEELHNNSTDAIHVFGYKLRQQSQWTTWTVVYFQEDDKGSTRELDDTELLKAWEFQMYKTTYDDLIDAWKMSGSRKGAKSPWGVLDATTGMNFLARNKPKKGVRLMAEQEPSPIFTLDDAFDKKLASLFSTIEEPKITIPDYSELRVFAETAYENAFKQLRGDGRRRYADDSPEGEEDERPMRRRRVSSQSNYSNEDTDEAPRSRFLRRDAEEPAQEEEQAEPARRVAAPVSRRVESEQPIRRSAVPPSVRRPEPEQEQQEEQSEQAQPAPRRTVLPPSVRRQEPEPEVEAEPEPEPAPPRKTAVPPPARRPEPEEQAQEEEPPPPPPRRVAAPPPRNVEPEEQAPEEDDGGLGPVRKPAVAPFPRPATRRVGPVSEPTDDDENVPEEATDPAPPIEETEEAKPVPVTVAPPRKPSNLSPRLIDKLKRGSS